MSSMMQISNGDRFRAPVPELPLVRRLAEVRLGGRVLAVPAGVGLLWLVPGRPDDPRAQPPGEAGDWPGPGGPPGRPLDLVAAFEALGQDPGVRAVVLASAGSLDPGYPAARRGQARVEMNELDEMDMVAYALAGQEAMGAVAGSDRPVVCAIDGPCLGPGLELALAADIRVAAPGATFGLPGLRTGRGAGWGGAQRLARLVGPGQAKRLVLGGAIIDAAEAHRIGLVELLAGAVDPSGLAQPGLPAGPGAGLEAALDLAAGWARGPAGAAGMAKEAIDAGLDLPLEAALRLEAAASGRLAGRGRPN